MSALASVALTVVALTEVIVNAGPQRIITHAPPSIADSSANRSNGKGDA